MKRRVLLGVLATLALAAPALTYAAYSSSRLPSDESAAAPIVQPATFTQNSVPRVPEEAAMVIAGMALIGAAAVVRRAA